MKQRPCKSELYFRVLHLMLRLRANPNQLEGAESHFKAYLIGQSSLEPFAVRKKNKRCFNVKVQLNILRGRA